ncbi:LytR/AlgR family response regulator transcription factor [Myroides sp. LJL119]
MISKVKCVLLDDELLGLKYLQMLSDQIPQVQIVAVFNNPMEFLQAQMNLDYQVLICDINMPGITGMEIAELVPDKAIIFCTAYKQYAVQAFEINAIDYLVKPIKKERLQKAIDKVCMVLHEKKRPTFLNVNTNKGKAIIQFDNIDFITTCETDPRDKELYFDNQTKIILKNTTLDKLMSSLPKANFCRVNKREIINYRIVSFYSYDQIHTTVLDSSGKPILVSLGASFKSDFLANI